MATSMLGAEGFAWLLVLSLSVAIYWPTLQRPSWISNYMVGLTVVLMYYIWLLLFIAPNWDVSFLTQDHVVWLSYLLALVTLVPLFCFLSVATSRVFLYTLLLATMVFAAAWLPPWGWWFIPLVLVAGTIVYYRYFYKRPDTMDSIPSRTTVWLHFLHEVLYVLVLSYVFNASVWWLSSDETTPLIGEPWNGYWYAIWISLFLVRGLEAGLIYYYHEWLKTRADNFKRVAEETQMLQGDAAL